MSHPTRSDRRCCWRSARGHRRPNRHPEHPDCGYQADPNWQGGDYYDTAANRWLGWRSPVVSRT
ncbi:hypothetical protein I552_8983 [Mycobacterium xenopi 3993]|nr:hypothetical protein I552_8983 [Mycobacterium xenopi 3993]